MHCEELTWPCAYRLLLPSYSDEPLCTIAGVTNSAAWPRTMQMKKSQVLESHYCIDYISSEQQLMRHAAPPHALACDASCVTRAPQSGSVCFGSQPGECANLHMLLTLLSHVQAVTWQKPQHLICMQHTYDGFKRDRSVIATGQPSTEWCHSMRNACICPCICFYMLLQASNKLQYHCNTNGLYRPESITMRAQRRHPQLYFPNNHCAQASFC